MVNELGFILFFLFIVEGYIDLEFIKLKDIKSLSYILDRSIFYVIVNFMKNSEFNLNYLVGGIGVVILIFLFMILI